MSYKILTKNGIDNTNIDGARAEYFNSGMRDGIVKGALNEGVFIANASNSISFDSCELRIAGHRVLIDEAIFKTFSNKPSGNTRFSFIAQIVINDNRDVEFSIIIQSSNTKLIQDDLYKNLNGSGTYQVEIGRFTQLTDGTITDVIRTIDVITGNGNLENEYIRIGKVTTTTLDTGINAEVDVENVVNEDTGLKETNFNFGIPQGSIIKINGEKQSEVEFSSDPQTQLDAKMDKAGTNLVYNDLNALPNTQYVTIIANTNTTINGPVSDSGVVIQKTASSSYKTQLFIANDVNTTTWRRNYRNGVWGEWKQIANTDGKYSSLISGGNVVIDTRNIDSPPSYYKNQQVCYEFKTASVIGLDTYMPGSTYVTLKSVKGWTGSGYLVYQEAVSANNNLGAIGDGTICFRYGNNETWGEWNKITTQSLAEREMGMLLPRGTKVEQDSDINSIEYVKIGNYYCSVNSTASTIQNLPEPTAFMMQVLSPLSTNYDNEETSTWVYRLRILTTHTGNVYYQYVSSGATAGVFSYGAWKKVIKSDDKLLTNKMDGFNSSFNTNQTGWIRLAEINDAYSPIILVLGGGYYTSQPSDGIFAISKTYGSPPIITQLVGRKKSWWDKIRIVYGESKHYIELNKTNTSNENIRFTLISDGPTGRNITINKSFVAGAIPSGYSSVEHTLVDGTAFQDLHLSGNLTDGTNSISVADIMSKANFVLDGTTLNITTT